MIPLRPECPLLPDIIQLMLPATFQTPAALVLLCGGLLACFAGYRVFRVVLGDLRLHPRRAARQLVHGHRADLVDDPDLARRQDWPAR